MLDEAGAANLLDQVHKLWVTPEVRRRYGDKGPPEGFSICQCLIRLPPDAPPIVEFNNEIQWLAEVRKPVGIAFDRGDAVLLHHIEEILSVRPPEYKGRQVAFICVQKRSDGGFTVVFDSTPSLPDYVVLPESEKWKYSDLVCRYLNAVIEERVIVAHDRKQQALASIGLWAAPALIPYPLSLCVQHLENNIPEAARAAVVQFCTPQWLEERAGTWGVVPELAARSPLVQQAVQAHKRGEYILAIHTIVPQIEGIVSDWIIRSSPEGTVNFRQQSKTKHFRDAVLDNDSFAFSYRRAVESAMSFILDGPVLETFKNWMDSPNSAFPNRNVVGHGRFDPSLFTEENSIKAFLLLDTLAFIIAQKDGTTQTTNPANQSSGSEGPDAS